MADIVEKIIIDDSAAIASFQDLDKQMAKLNDKIRELEDSYKAANEAAAKSAEEAASATSNLKDQISKAVAEALKAERAQKQFNSTIYESVRDIKLFGTSIGGVIDGLQKKAVAMRAVTSAVGGGTKALQIFKVALISTGIGAIVVALGSFVALLTKSQKGMDAVNVVLKAVGAALDVFVDRAVKFGSALVNLFQGNFKAALTDAKAAVTGLGDEIRKEVSAAAALERRVQGLRDQVRATNVAYAEQRAEIEKLKKAAEDVTKSTTERQKAAEKAASIESALVAQRVAIAKEELAIVQEKNALGESTAADLDAEAEARIKVAEIEQESFTLQTELQNKINSLKAEANAKAAEAIALQKQLTKEFEDQYKVILDAVQKLELEQLSPEERVQREAEIAKAAVEAQIAKVEAAAKAAGKEVDLTEEKAALIKGIEEQTQKEIAAIRKQELEESYKTVKEIPRLYEQAAKATVPTMEELMKQTHQVIITPAQSLALAMDKIKKKFLDTFNISEEEAKLIAKSLGGIFNSLTSLTDAAIAENDALLASLQERREAIEESLEEELLLQEKGLANSVSSKKKELEAIAKEEEQAKRKAEELRKKQVAAQLIADAAAQASNIITMATNVVAAESSKGVIGVAIAATAIAAFVGLISKFKASQAKLSGGGDIAGNDTVTGFVNTSGRTDRGGARGHRVEDSNLVLGGREFVVSETPAHLHSDFLKNLNAGKYNDRDLIRELAGVNGAAFANDKALAFERKDGVIRKVTERNRQHFQVAALDVLMSKHIGAVEKRLKGMGGNRYVVPRGGGDVYEVDSNGNTKVIRKDG